MSTDQDRRAPACVLVIFGASGDLTARKLLPALERLAGYGALPAEVALVGVARTPMTDDEFGELCRAAVGRDGQPAVDRAYGDRPLRARRLRRPGHLRSGWPR